jgi:hypothetical protein
MNSSNPEDGPPRKSDGSPHLPMPGKVWADRASQPPPVPETARKRTPFPAPRAPPPLPQTADGEDPRETTDPSIRTTEYRKTALLQILRSFYPDQRTRLQNNGNSLPVLQSHLNRAREDLIMRLESQSLYLFVIPMKWVALAATAIAIAAGGLAIHSCQENKKLEERIEQLETKGKAEQQEKAKPEAKKVNSYIPKALNKPPFTRQYFPKAVPKRIARNSLQS